MSNKISNARIGAVSQSQLPYVEITANKQPNAYIPNTDTYEYCVGDLLGVAGSMNLIPYYNSGSGIAAYPIGISGAYWQQYGSLGTHLNPYAESGAINLVKTTTDSNGNAVQVITTLADDYATPTNPKIEFIFSRVSINSTSWGVWVMEKGELPTIETQLVGTGPVQFADAYMYGVGVLHKRQAYIVDSGGSMVRNGYQQYYGFHLILNGVPFTSGKSEPLITFTNSTGTNVSPQNKNFNYASIGGVVLQACDLEPSTVGSNADICLRVYNPNFQNGTYQVALEGLSYI